MKRAPVSLTMTSSPAVSADAGLAGEIRPQTRKAATRISVPTSRPPNEPRPVRRSGLSGASGSPCTSAEVSRPTT